MSKFFIILMSIVAILMLAMISQDTSNDLQEPEYVPIAQRVRANAIRRIVRKHQLHPAGTYGGMPYCVELLGAAFQSRCPLSRDEARSLIISMVQEFLDEINASEEIRPFLVNYPFRIENIEITIFISDERKRLYDPQLSFVTTNKEKILYITRDSNDRFNYKNKYEETYEEALAIVQSQ